MSRVVLQIIVVLVIICIGGFFAASEMALVSLREGQIRALGKRGRRGQKTARLAQDPNRFFSAVQIGVTLATLVSGAYGAETLAGALKTYLIRQHLSQGWAGPVSFLAVTIAITFFSLILGELAPKRIGLQRAPALALLAGPLLDRIATLARPFVWLLITCTNLVVAVFGADPRIGRQAMTEQEVRELVASTQTISPDERKIVSEVFDAGKRQIREVLVPRTEVVFLDAETPVEVAAGIAAGVPHSRLPVYQDSYDNVTGFVHVRDLFGPSGRDQGPVPVSQISRPVKFLPISKTVLSSLSEMRRERAHLAVVIDDYGGTAGIVTLEDLVEELIGDIRDEYDIEQDQATKLPAGDVELDGLLNLSEFTEQTGIELPEGPYETVAGYVLAALGDLPSEGDRVQVAGRTITVTELDGRRIARLRVTPSAQPAGAAPPASHGAPVSAGQVRLDSEAPQESGPVKSPQER
ncbi:MAG TPA: hemolysin family protein [Streptosporangiaceae bacterium]|nr:hemolysin family protein [Streptosporangiaceae bacterium]